MTVIASLPSQSTTGAASTTTPSAQPPAIASATTQATPVVPKKPDGPRWYDVALTTAERLEVKEFLSEKYYNLIPLIL